MIALYICEMEIDSQTTECRIDRWMSTTLTTALSIVVPELGALMQRPIRQKTCCCCCWCKAHLYQEFVVCLWWLCHSDKCVVRNGWQINDVKDCPVVRMVAAAAAVFVTCWAMNWMFVRYVICNSVLTILYLSSFIKHISVLSMNTDKNEILYEFRSWHRFA